MINAESLIFVGPSGSGKTTLVNGLRLPKYAGDIVIPKRSITRPLRENDDLGENNHVSHDAFRKMVKRGLINPYWSRKFGEDRQENYGLEAVDPDDRRLRILSANDAILLDTNNSVQSTLETGMVVGLMAPPDLREERLRERSPDMDEAERAIRLEGDDIGDMLDHSGLYHILIDTSRPLEFCHAVVGALVDSILYARAQDQE